MSEEKNVPNIRFKGFTDPWEQRKLGDVSSKVTEKNKSKKYTETLTNSAEYGIINQYAFFDKSISNSNSIASYYVVKRDNFVYNPRISTAAPVGPINRNRLNIIGIMSPLYYVFEATNIDKSYLEYYFKTTKWHNFMKIEGNTGARSDRLAIKDKVLVKMPIPYPKVKEQKQIGELFESIDTTIALHQQKVTQLKELKKLLMQKIFDQEWRFRGFTDPWEQRKLGECLNVNSGKDYKSLKRGNIPVYGTGGYMCSVDQALSYNEDAIGIGRKGTINKPYILKAPFWTVDTLFYIVPKAKLNLFFMYLIFQKVNWKRKDESTGVPSLSKSIIKSVKELFPKGREQNEIAELFEILDTTIALHQQKVDQLKELKKYLMQNLFV
ncbi:restriction endonuclease subunit S [Pediococcus acidilactici]